jgi:ABC-2 type transport system ATP-binding protein
MIELFNLKKRYHDGTYALKGITIRLPKRVTAVIGRNGAGKTTMIRILSTQLEPTSGTATVGGYDILNDTDAIRAHTSSIPQEASPIGFLTPIEHIRIYLLARGMSFKEANAEGSRALKDLELWNAKDTPTDVLSGGMKRKLFVAMALAANADTVFLDEPTTGLDPLSRFEVWAAIKELNGNVILTTHYMDEAQQLADEVVLVDQGKVLERGSVGSLLERFKGKVRVESSDPKPKARMQYKVGTTRISYVKKSMINEFISMGCTVRPITLDDLFIVHGVDLQEEGEGGEGEW